MNAQDNPDIMAKWNSWTPQQQAEYCEQRASLYPFDHPQRTAILEQAKKLRGQA